MCGSLDVLRLDGCDDWLKSPTSFILGLRWAYCSVFFSVSALQFTMEWINARLGFIVFRYWVSFQLKVVK